MILSCVSYNDFQQLRAARQLGGLHLDIDSEVNSILQTASRCECLCLRDRLMTCRGCFPAFCSCMPGWTPVSLKRNEQVSKMNGFLAAQRECVRTVLCLVAATAVIASESFTAGNSFALFSKMQHVLQLNRISVDAGIEKADTKA